MKSQKLEFEGAYGDRLAARLDLPEEVEAEATALFAHCFTCSKNLKAIDHICEALTDKKIGVFRFDFTGLGHSEGDFSDTNFSSNVDDLIKAADCLKNKLQAPSLLVGHSLGGAAVLQAAHQIDSSKAVATIGSPCNPKHVKQNFTAQLEEINEKGHAEVSLGGRSFNIKKQFLDDLKDTRMDERIQNLDRALMVFHSPVDNIVGIENAGHIFTQAKHPKSFISLDDADHLLSRKEDSIYVGTMLSAWAYKYL